MGKISIFQREVSKNRTKNIQVQHKKLKKISTSGIQSTNLFDENIVIGSIVTHQRFGEGEVLKIEGVGANKKAEIKFNKVGTKKLLLQFAKLTVIS
ncbi:MAG: hypothetical protein ACWA42_00165 [Lutibacter sp.]